MAGQRDKNLGAVEHALKFLHRHLQNILTEDFDAVDEAEMAVVSALRALEEYRLSLDSARDAAVV